MPDITWNCDRCDFPVSDGILFVPEAEVIAAEESGNVMDWEPARWRAVHLECEPDPNGYAVAVHEVSTYAQMLWWTAHLSGKNWLSATNWNELILRAVPKP